MSRELLFVYGTLQDPAVQRRVIGRTIAGIPDILDDYQKTWIELESGTYATLVPRAGAPVEGRVLELSAEELLATDAYETDAYRRTRVTLRSGRSAWVYRA